MNVSGGATAGGGGGGYSRVKTKAKSNNPATSPMTDLEVNFMMME